MKRSRISTAVITCAIAATLVANAGCIGNFKLTKSIDEWNKSLGGKWTQEVIFLPLAFFIYPWTLLGDAVIFNSIEFWTGANVLDQPEEGEATTRTVTDGDAEVVLSRRQTRHGPQIGVRISESGRLVDEFVLLIRGDTVVKQSVDGRTIASARILPDGSLRVEEQGEASVYSGEEIARLTRR